MRTEVFTIAPETVHTEAVQRATRVLNEGGLVAFPTETVYGLGVRADLPEAVERLRAAKGRAAEKAFTVHIGSREDARRFVPELNGVAQRLIRKGWPGPLTLVLRVEDATQAEILTGRNGSFAQAMYYDGSIGLRCPDDTFALALLQSVRGPVIASSANRSGHSPPVNGADVRKELDGEIDLLVDTGATRYSRPSTIVRVDKQGYEVLREGVLDARMVERMAELRLLFVCTGNTCRSPMAAGLAGKMLADRLGCSQGDLAKRGVQIESAGMAGGIGRAADHAVEVMAERGIDISDHSSSYLSPQMIQRADYVFAMTRGHLQAVVELSPTSESRVFLLRQDEDLQDPVGGSLEEYEACVRRIEQGLEARLREIPL